jgi:hypothetical protein
MENIKKNKLPCECPSCQAILDVNRLSCPACGTAVEGDYALPLLARLGPAEQEFILQFVKMSGSLKEMAGIMGRSYPSVRNYLDELIAKLEKMENPKTK